jgi:peptide chain release factor 2
LANLKEETEEIEKLNQNFKEIQGIINLQDKTLDKEIGQGIDEIEKQIKKQEIKTFLSGKYDKGNAILSVFAGAGGQDAQDWATMLLRMYQRFCEQKGFKTKMLHQAYGEPGGPDGRIGTKAATLEVKGKFAYGNLRGEAGVHRLVRISPFSSQKLRHTSFALIEILPEISKTEESEMKVNPDDLRIDIYRSSGAGGQNVNKRETAARITHLPTGIVAACQSERQQGLNKEKAMKLLLSKLYQLKQKQEEKEIKQVKGDKVSNEWGSQIRSYVLHPYKMVKDLRTGVETSVVESVLDGNLDEFIEAEIKNDKI